MIEHRPRCETLQALEEKKWIIAAPLSLNWLISACSPAYSSLVRETGLEPVTPCSQGMYATNCATLVCYTPRDSKVCCMCRLASISSNTSVEHCSLVVLYPLLITAYSLKSPRLFIVHYAAYPWLHWLFNALLCCSTVFFVSLLVV